MKSSKLFFAVIALSILAASGAGIEAQEVKSIRVTAPVMIGTRISAVVRLSEISDGARVPSGILVLIDQPSVPEPFLFKDELPISPLPQGLPQAFPGSLQKNQSMERIQDQRASAAERSAALGRIFENAALADAERVAKAEEVLGRSLEGGPRTTLLSAHRVGEGEVGRDGVRPASVFNYAFGQLKRKVAELKSDYGRHERRALIGEGLAGSAVQEERYRKIERLLQLRKAARAKFDQAVAHRDAEMGRVSTVVVALFAFVGNYQSRVYIRSLQEAVNGALREMNNIEAELRSLKYNPRDPNDPYDPK